jgi:hypothetical protein
VNAGVRRQLQAIADAAGSNYFELIRENKHLIVDFWFPGEAKPARMSVAKTGSDHRGIKNLIADLRRLKGSNQ